jgi:fructose-1,6-bisphosphatase I / sedoheptulose-1,7-bisphosphatase
MLDRRTIVVNPARAMHHTTLSEFLTGERRRYPHATGELNALVIEVAFACKAIAARLAYGKLGEQFGEGIMGDSEPPRRALPAVADELFVRATEWGGHVAGMVSKDRAVPIAVRPDCPLGRYLLVFDALDGSADVDVNVTAGSLFSILRARNPETLATAGDYLQTGNSQLCAGYAVYGASTMLVLSVGSGTHGFTLEPHLGEFLLTHPHLRVARDTNEFAIDASNSRLWEPAIKRYIDECIAGSVGIRGKDFDMRWVASLVAETHRILLRGGVFLAPLAGSGDRTSPRLLHEANPVSFIIEQAGGAASTGHARILELAPNDLNHRVGLIFGARDEVERIEAYHRDHNLDEYDAPLFGDRGLFRSTN